MHPITCRPILAILAAAMASAASAAQPPDAVRRARTLAPFIDEQTVLVVQVDASRVEVDPLIDQLVQWSPEARLEEARSRSAIKAAQTAFLRAGGKGLYLVVSLADVDYRRGAPGPFLVVPLSEGVDQKAVTALLRTTPLETTERLGDALFAGGRSTLARLKAGSADPRPELAAALRAAGDAAVGVLLLPPRYSRRVIEEMLPTLPPEIGGGPSSLLTRGLLWMAVGVDPPPKTSLRVVIQSQDEQAAAALHGKWVDGFRNLARHEEVRRMIPTFEKIAGLLTPNVQGDRLMLTLDTETGGIDALLAAVKPSIERIRDRAARQKAMNNLKQIGLGFMNHESAQKHFPATASRDADGRPLLSWRVHILPYVEQYKLYKQFHLDEPWDSPHNRKLIDRMPDIYRSPASKLREKGLTSYVAPVGEGTAFQGTEPLTLKQITDGSVRTILVVEVDDDHAVVWTKPEDLQYDPQDPAQGLGGLFQGGFNAAFCDCSVRFLENTTPPEVLRALFSRAGGEKLSFKGGKMRVIEQK